MPDTSLTQAEQVGDTQTGAIRPRFAALSDRMLAWIFLTPTMALLLLIAIFPLIWSLYLSFTKYSVIKDADAGPIWIGLENYAKLLGDPNIWGRFTTTAGLVVPAV